MPKIEKPGYAVCGTCAEVINLAELEAARKAGLSYIHKCNRVLVWPNPREAGGNAEVSTGSDIDPGPGIDG